MYEWKPFTTNPLIMFIIFVVSVLMCHLIFIKWLNLSSRIWKGLDYLWLALTSLSIIGYIGEAQHVVNRANLPLSSIYRDNKYKWLHDRLDYMTSGVICRSFIETEYSPDNLEKTQEEYDKVCQFVNEALTSFPQNINDAVGWTLPESRPIVKNEILQEELGYLDEALMEFSNACKTYQHRKETSENQNDVFKIMWPLFAILALALRITKVTHELKS